MPFYAILRAVPSKLGGALALVASVGVLFFLPALQQGNRRLIVRFPSFKWVPFYGTSWLIRHWEYVENPKAWVGKKKVRRSRRVFVTLKWPRFPDVEWVIFYDAF